jgi:hypothetical protein
LGASGATCKMETSLQKAIAYQDRGEVSSGLIARLHEQGVPVIVISGSSESPSLLPVEAATILEKPFGEAQLLASFARCLHRRSPGEA